MPPKSNEQQIEIDIKIPSLKKCWNRTVFCTILLQCKNCKASYKMYP